MVSSLAASVRITARKSAVWRNCRVCGLLAPLSLDEDLCRDCQPAGATAGHAPRRSRPAARPGGRN
jgi:hypothetical protein